MVTTEALGEIAKRSVPDAIRHTFNKPDGTPRDISAHTLEVWIKEAGADGAVLPVRTPTLVTDGTDGVAQYVFQEGDFSSEGTGDNALKIQFVAYLDDGAGNITERHISNIAAIDVSATFASSQYGAA